ncbi:hypothetical protein FNF29_04398 [Cafeteria roenbergensis]|uniref:Uncharacterized protein n=2 Tax=Cafeteria roenbergensis TaxID=33653 RepID=A0A5A8CIQ1_CAFRO|nr:hypothetical protein FNF29_04398 [Cafeteria roenbergensis]|eukprot:KAA0151711.1 hypothetical protein FNF29_04398 [Cafeteria roenbergensis]
MADPGFIRDEAELASRKPPARQLFADGGHRLMPFAAVDSGPEKDEYAMRADRQDAFEDATGMARAPDGSTGLTDGQLARATTGDNLDGVFPRAGMARPLQRHPSPAKSASRRDYGSDDGLEGAGGEDEDAGAGADDDFDDDDDDEEGLGARAAGSDSDEAGGGDVPVYRPRPLSRGRLLAAVEGGKEEDAEEDADSVARALNADPAEGARSEKEKEMFQLQAQIRTIMANKQVLRRQARNLRREQIGFKRAIATLEAERSAMGGRDAVVENDKTVQRGKEIMTRRIMKARADKMRAVGDNADIRKDIDVRRREKVAMLRACSRLEGDVRALQDATRAQLITIAEADEETRAVETQIAGVIEAARRELRDMETEWERLSAEASKPDFGSGLPSARDRDLDAQVDRELAAAERELLRGKPRQRGIFDGGDPLRKRKRKGAKEGKHAENVAASAAAVMRMRVSTKPSWAPRGTGSTTKPGGSKKAKRRGGSASTTRGTSAGGSTVQSGRAGSAGGASRGGDSATSSGGGSSAGRPQAKTLLRSRWKNAAMHARVGQTQSRVEQLQSAFEELQALVGGSTPQEAVDLVLARKEEVGRLYARVSKLGQEADGIRAEIMECRRAGRSDAVKARVEEAERQGLLSTVGSSLAAAQLRLRRQDAERVALEASLTALRDGLVGVLESLDLGSVVRAAEGDPSGKRKGQKAGSPSRQASTADVTAAGGGGGGGGGGGFGPSGTPGAGTMSGADGRPLSASSAASGAAKSEAPPLNARLLVSYFAAAEQRLYTLLSDYSRLSASSKRREAEASALGRSGSGATAQRDVGARRGSFSRDSVRRGAGAGAGPGAGGAGGAGAGAGAGSGVRMSRAERRRSVDLSVADLRRHQLMQAIQNGAETPADSVMPGGSLLSAGQDDAELGTALSKDALRIGPSVAAALPTTLDSFTKQARAAVRSATGSRGGGSRGGNRRGSAMFRGQAAGAAQAQQAPAPAVLSSLRHGSTAPVERFGPRAQEAFERQSQPAEARGRAAAQALRGPQEARAAVPRIHGMAERAV